MAMLQEQGKLRKCHLSTRQTKAKKKLRQTKVKATRVSHAKPKKDQYSTRQTKAKENKG